MSLDSAAISVIGAGSYGTALAICLARNGHKTLLWGRDENHVAEMASSRANEKYLPGSSFPETLVVTNDLASVIAASKNILLVVPSHVFGEMLTQIKPFLRKDARLVWATKGLEHDTGLLQ